MKRILALCLILIAVGWSQFYIFYFGHYHVAGDGTLVYHSHPFQKSANAGSPPGHTHTRKELQWSAQLIHALSLLFFYAIIIFLFLERNKADSYQDVRVPDNRLHTIPSMRAPPRIPVTVFDTV